MSYLQQLNEIIEAEKPGLEVYSMLTLEVNNTELDLSKGAVEETQILSSSYPVEYVDFGPYGGNGRTFFQQSCILAHLNNGGGFINYK